jgi:hypothetical protein
MRCSVRSRQRIIAFMRFAALRTLSILLITLLLACGDDSGGGGEAGDSGDGASGEGGTSGDGAGTSGNSGTGGDSGTGGTSITPGELMLEAGNPDGNCAIPEDAQPEDISSPDHVIGTGTPASCTGAAVVEAVAQGGVITFDCGDDPVTITLTETAKVFNDKGDVTIDGGGKVTLSGADDVRILYMNTCDEAQVFTTARCDNQDHPKLTVQNIAFDSGNHRDEGDEGGGAIFASGGRFKAINSVFTRNRCHDVGPEVGGAAIRVFQQSEGLPAYVVNCTFGGSEALGNECSNGAGLSSIGVSWTVLNSLFTHNRAVGTGANPAQPGTPGGGNGGAIYNDGGEMTLRICGSVIEDNHANEGGGAILFVSNDRTGSLVIEDSLLRRNESAQFETEGFPGIFVLADGDPQVSGSTLE